MIQQQPTAGGNSVIAASIAYTAIDRPSWVPEDFRAGSGEEIQFLRLRTLDGNFCDAVLRRPGNKSAEDTLVVISIHGSGGNYALSGSGVLVRNLAHHGHAVIGVNTRQHDEHIYTENFFDVRHDIEAAVYVARSIGYRKIVLHGQSLGNIHVQYYAATNWNPDTIGVVLTGMFASLPWKSRYLLIGNEDKYRGLTAQSVEQLHNGRGDAYVKDTMPMGDIEPAVRVTAQHFLTYRCQSVSAADGVYWIKRIPVPILMVRDEGDATVRNFEPGMLLSSAQDPHSLVPHIELASLPNGKGLNPRGHSFADTQGQLMAVVVDWLNRLQLRTTS